MTVTKIECPSCQGNGYRVYLEAYTLYEPDEIYETCDICLGEGDVEVCAYCREPLKIRNGQETCACDVISLPKAA